MKLKDISLDYLKRRKSKMAFLIIGMVIGIATIVTIFTITEAMQEGIQKNMDEFGANILVIPKTNILSMSYGGISVPGAQYDIQEIKEEELDNIWTIKNKENLAIVSPKLLGAVDLGEEKVLVVGANLTTEIELKKWWEFTNDSDIELIRIEEPSPVNPTRTTTVTKVTERLKENDVIIGSRVAKILNKKPGDKINANNQEFNIKGVLERTGSQGDDSAIFMELKIAQKLLGKEGKITLVEVAAICLGCPVEEMARQINEAIPEGEATPIKQVVKERMQTIQQLSNFGFAAGIIVLIIGSLIVFTTMMSSVNERTREIGIFRAIGFRRMHITKIILMESLILSFISGVVGYTLGMGAALLAGSMMVGMEVLILFDLYLAAGALGLAIFVGTAATIYPALKASNIDPAEALRQI
ncbi:MAG: ABC transporter permease [Actinobacteria bacterium]|nr:ABC transporter permease [Actinomycetota bacterium]